MLPADQRLRANRDFRFVYARGRSYAHGLAVLYALQRSGPKAQAAPGRRIGFVLSKKQGDAADRNRMKRQLREAVRLRLPDLQDGPFDLVFVGRKGLAAASWPEIQTAVEELFRRALVFAPSAAEALRGLRVL